jgi:predicted DCC family thiol-disulfide oxidoreductase YuxK
MSLAPDNLMLFDGVCRFCSIAVRMAMDLDTKAVLKFTPLQSPYGRALAERYGISAIDPDSFVFFDKGRPRQRSDGALALVTRLRMPWSGLVILRLMTPKWRDGAYAWLAKNRYRYFGKYEACMVPTPEQAARFITEIP